MKVTHLLFLIGTSMAAVVPLPPIAESDYVISPNNYYQVAPYQDEYPPYVLYNVVPVNTGPRTIAPVFAPGKALPQVPYYGTPIYDFRFALNPVFPGTRPLNPGYVPNSKPTEPTTSKAEADEDTIEKLDEKIDPELASEKAKKDKEEETDDDTVSVDVA